MRESNVELARRGYGAALRGDVDALREFRSIGELVDVVGAAIEMVHYPRPEDAPAAVGLDGCGALQRW